MFAGHFVLTFKVAEADVDFLELSDVCALNGGVFSDKSHQVDVHVAGRDKAERT